MRQALVITGMCAFMAALGFGCGGDGGGGPVTTAASLTASGWGHFEDDEFDEALGKFHEALDLDIDYADAYNGLGWTHAKMDSLDQAKSDFRTCIAKDTTLADPHAGKAAVFRDYEDEGLLAGSFFADPAYLDSAITSANRALAKDPEYEFDHDDFNWEDLRLIMAQCHFGLGEYEEANAQVEALGYDGADPESPTFVEDLAEIIEEIEADIGG
jgi:tetratricopeptide (TPR) repeat protein